MSYRKEQQEAMRVTPATYNTLQTKFESEWKLGNRVLDYGNTMKALRDEMNVLDNIQGLIYGGIKDDNRQEYQDGLKQYILVKKILNSLSVQNGKQRVIYSEIVKEVLIDLKMMKSRQWNDNKVADLHAKLFKIKIKPGDKYQKHLTNIFIIDCHKLSEAINDSKENQSIDYEKIEEIFERVIENKFSKRDTSEVSLEKWASNKYIR